MEKLKSSLVNMVVVLVVVAAVSSGLLAFVNDMTKDTIAQQNAQKLADGIKVVMCADDLTVKADKDVTLNIGGKDFAFVVHEITDAQGNDLGAAVESTTMGFGGDLKVLVGLNPEGEVLGYTLLAAQETPGLGAKADNWFQKDGKGSIIGKTAGELTVDKDGGDVAAITASTITTRAFLKAINQAYAAYKGNADGMTGASPQK